MKLNVHCYEASFATKEGELHACQIQVNSTWDGMGSDENEHGVARFLNKLVAVGDNDVLSLRRVECTGVEVDRESLITRPGDLDDHERMLKAIANAAA